ncbi:MAG TPA: hypothetical protein VIY69_10480 [Candidatus Acidoferrales bacterium]
MRVHDLYHGSNGDKILAIIREGVMRPNNGVLFFGRFESQYPHLFQYGADSKRGASYVIKVRVSLPEGAELKSHVRGGAPSDSWLLETRQVVSCQVLELYIREKGNSTFIFDKVTASEIHGYLEKNPKPS